MRNLLGPGPCSLTPLDSTSVNSQDLNSLAEPWTIIPRADGDAGIPTSRPKRWSRDSLQGVGHVDMLWQSLGDGGKEADCRTGTR